MSSPLQLQAERMRRDEQVRMAINQRLIESGEKTRLKALLREKLVECGWRDSLKDHCRGACSCARGSAAWSCIAWARAALHTRAIAATHPLRAAGVSTPLRHRRLPRRRSTPARDDSRIAGQALALAHAHSPPPTTTRTLTPLSQRSSETRGCRRLQWTSWWRRLRRAGVRQCRTRSRPTCSYESEGFSSRSARRQKSRRRQAVPRHLPLPPPPRALRSRSGAEVCSVHNVNLN